MRIIVDDMVEIEIHHYSPYGEGNDEVWIYDHFDTLEPKWKFTPDEARAIGQILSVDWWVRA